ncbi:hypothetical protein CYMTET_32076 [Cymbomonas tetramitiformis]|uniref:Uncharacterized protein n=1 Tax=Cymbomonas tetramitiformis TaxID=36881 RepID=A0AAE0FG01_9CHLO|nr:hypothetical protein CYMTET_32076 [Cymbomonas tetramitiformis]
MPKNASSLFQTPKKEFPEVVFGEEIDVVSDLLQVDIGRLYLGLKSEDQNRKEYGWLTLMASSSAFQIGDVVVPGAPNPEPVATFKTVIADLDPPDATSHEGGLDAEGSVVAEGMTPAAFASAVHADEDFDFPALYEPKWWKPSFNGASAAGSSAGSSGSLQFQ